MNTFGQYYIGTLVHPTRTFADLLNDDRRLRFGWYAIGINMILYTWVYINLTQAQGAPSSFTPWLAIPKESYYYFNRFLLAPSMLICWISAAGLVQLLSKPFDGKGTFEDTLSLLGFAISISCLASLVHDLPDTVLGAVGFLNLREYEVALNSPTIWRTILWICYGTSFILFVLLFWKTVRAVHKIHPIPAFVIGCLGFVTYQVLFLVFNR
jgi:hypothetical protein